MCGLAGVVNTGSIANLHSMSAAIAHRGPDGSGVEWFGNSGLAHRRLAILDLSPSGHQPMSNEDGTVWIVLNGEIYNFKDIKKELEVHGHTFHSQSDTEVLLKAYLQWGEAALSRLNGMFAFAIYDNRQGSLFAARDRMGIKPFYYATSGAGLVFASEIKAILASGLVEKKPDFNSLHTPTRFQVSPYTGFVGVRKLPPGHFLRFANGNFAINQYWSISPTEDDGRHEESSVDELDRLLNDSVKLQMTADVPIGVLLSGGLDSSVIAALARRNTSADIGAFTIKFSAQDQRHEKMVDDSVYARRIADAFGFRYHEIELHPDITDLLPKIIWHLDEPLADPAAINTYLISKAAREHGITVLLNGMGGDEIFGGYRKHLACLMADTYQRLLPRIARSGIERLFNALPVASARRGFKSIRWSKRFLSFASRPEAERFMMSDLSLSEEQYARCFVDGQAYRDTHFYTTEEPVFRANGISYLTQMCLADTMYFLPDHNLLYSDKASMAVGVEGRPPLTDHRIVELMFTLPPAFRIKRRIQKYLLKKVANRYLSGDIVHRPKAPFGAPLRSWIRGPLAPMVNDLLSEETVRRRGLYRAEYISALIAADREGREDNAHLIWMFLTNELWFRTFFGN